MTPTFFIRAVFCGLLAVVVGCASGDDATVAVSLGQSVQEALSLEGVTITGFEMVIACDDGRNVTVIGDVDGQGNFAASVPRCTSATIDFHGLADDGAPALAGDLTTPIRPPITHVVIPVQRVGMVSVLNDDTYASRCALTVSTAPELDQEFVLQPGEELSLLLPVRGVQLTCAPADTCVDVASCSNATTQTVAVSFGAETTVSLANLANALIFAIAPSQVTAGAAFGAFEVQLVDERNVVIPRSGVAVTLSTTSASDHGGFTGERALLNEGTARFDNVAFATAGPLTVRASATVDGVVLETAPVTLDVIADIAAALLVLAPASVTAGTSFALELSATDQFGNSAVLPTDMLLSSDDPQTQQTRIEDVVDGVATFTLYTVGEFTVTAQEVDRPTVRGSAVIDVTAGALSVLALGTSSVRFVAGEATEFTVRATDAFDNNIVNYSGTVSLQTVRGNAIAYPGPHEFAPEDNGTFTFTDVVFDSVGTWIVVASDGTLTSAALSVEVVR